MKKGSLHINSIDILGMVLSVLGLVLLRASTNIYPQLIGGLLLFIGGFILTQRAGK